MIIVKDRGNKINVTHRQRTYKIHEGGRRGLPGIQGEPGQPGVPGEGVPTGGSVGQVLTKQSNADYDTGWEEVPSAPVSSVNGQTGAVVLDKTDIGLGNVDNTSDVNKPVSTAMQTALNTKEPTITTGTTAQYLRGDKSWQTLDKTAVGLPNVDNTSDVSKPISTATQSALDLKANDTDVVHDTGNETIAGVKTFSSDPLIPDEIYGAGWNGALEPPTKNAVYDKIESMGSAGITRVVTVTSGSFTAGSAANTDYVYIINGAHVPTMPTAVGNTNRYTLKNDHTENVEVAFTSSQTADGGGIILGPEESVDLISNNVNWSII